MRSCIMLGVVLSFICGCTTRIYSFDQETYDSWDDVARQVFDYRDMTWTENGDKIAAKCYENLPTVEYFPGHPSDKWEGKWGYISYSEPEIYIFDTENRSCETIVHTVYHEFTHHLLECSYDDKSHNPEYFGEKYNKEDGYRHGDEFMKHVETLQQEICD